VNPRTVSLTKAQFVAQITLAAGGDLTRRGAAGVADALFAEVRAALLREGRFSWNSFGTFALQRRQPRRGKTPAGRPFTTPGGAAVRFRPAPRLRRFL